jgi:hypothetical protein
MKKNKYPQKKYCPNCKNEYVERCYCNNSNYKGFNQEVKKVTNNKQS